MSAPRSIHDKVRRERNRARALLAGLSREALEVAGDRIQAAQDQLDEEIDRVAIHVAGAVNAGIPMSEIAKLTGLSRQKLYELKKRGGGDRDDLPYRALAVLAGAGALDSGQLASNLEVDADEIEPVVRSLLTQGWVRPLITQYQGGASMTLLKLAEPGEAALEDWLLSGLGNEAETMTVYVGLQHDEAAVIEAEAREFFGPEWFALIAPGTVGDQKAPELAFRVVAHDQEEAVARAGERMQQLRASAGVKPRPVLITLILADKSTDFLRWRGAKTARAEAAAENE